MDSEQIVAREAELQKEKCKLEAKLKSQEKKVDYLERAKRLEEIPMLQKSIEEQDQKFWEQEAERIATVIEERRLAVANRERLQRMKPDKEAFLNKLKSEKNIVYEDKLREFEKLLEEERRKRLAQRKIARKEERRQKYIREKEQEAERKKKEEIRREEEEERRKKEEEKKRRKKEKDEKRMKKEEERRKKKEEERKEKRTRKVWKSGRRERKARNRRKKKRDLLTTEEEGIWQVANRRR